MTTPQYYGDGAPVVTVRGKANVRTIHNRGTMPGHNDLCPCKSGKKFKRCHGKRK